MRWLKWLYPGLNFKRWLLLAFAGLLLAAAGIGLLSQLLPFEYQVVLRVWCRELFGPGRAFLGGTLFLLLGLPALVYGILRAFRSVVDALVPEKSCNLADILYARGYLRRGPRIVVIGGGTGLAVLLKGLKRYTSNITAIVTVADDGGSSGRLRGELGMLPPGDIRNCLVALADKESLMEELLQYRFKAGDLAGHNLGNLLLAALNDMVGGFREAVQALSRVLAVRGQVLPVTLDNVVLGAELADGTLVCGESAIPRYKKGIKRVFLIPGDCSPLPEALRAIAEADAVVLGPGSLYTSVLPNLLVRGIAEALARCRAVRVYVCNIMTQPGETDGYTAADHLQAIFAHAGPLVDIVVVNQGEVPPRLKARYRREGAVPVVADVPRLRQLGVEVVGADLVHHEGNVVRHHPDRLARLVLELALRSGNSLPLPQASRGL
ncbi:gluconeogenesis factor YvcK family protein [Desulfovirgula thermocuniculi]|uniref:gluconeogenesis factor YvcK family protein n=1 Tax=Desulfovirgula thermocuniculi TaxID=348842 RepID=UPI0004113B61|nr:gluconeogenesis factor YvcK family protein [Desulfovirgula thermocuniculi]